MSYFTHTYWPPNPAEESWQTDLPNEGITFEGSGDVVHDVYSCNDSYHGRYLFQQREWDLPRTEDSEYGRAFQAISKLGVYHLGNIFSPEQVKEVLGELGWREVEYHEDEEGNFFRYVQNSV